MRHIEKADLPFVVECERLSHETFDEDFQMAVWPSYMPSEADFLSMIGQYRSTFKGMKETRFRVARRWSMACRTCWVGTGLS